MQENTEEKPSRLKAAMQNAVRYAGIGAVFGYVSHIFFGNPRQTGFFSKAAANRVFMDASFFGAAGAVIGAIWPKLYSRQPEKVELVVRSECEHHTPQTPYMNAATTQQMQPEHENGQQPATSYAALEEERRATPPQQEVPQRH